MRHLHLIAFNVPDPPNYGGVIDVFYRIKAFYELGISITLHCFYHDRSPSKKLEEWCSAVHYYPRKPALQSLSWQYPMMMKSRRSQALVKNLHADDSPIFFEGIQTCYNLTNEALKNKTKIIKLHNIEWKYYKALGEATSNPFLKLFYLSESWRLYHTEKIFEEADYLLAVSKQEADYYGKRFQGVKQYPNFHGNRSVTSKPGKGNYLLYHGNLEIAENQQAVRFLLTKVMPFVDQQLIIAGKNPTKGLIDQIAKSSNSSLIENPSDHKLQELMHEAQIHLLPSFQNTGFKIKLVNTLYQGRHCLVTPEMAEGSGLEELCHVASDSQTFVKYVKKLAETPFTQSDIDRKETYLNTYFSDIANAESISKLIFRRSGD